MKEHTSPTRIPESLNFEKIGEMAKELKDQTRIAAYQLFNAWIKTWPKKN